MRELALRTVTGCILILVCGVGALYPPVFFAMWSFASIWILGWEWPRLVPHRPYSGMLYPGIPLALTGYLFMDTATRYLVWIGIASAVIFDTGAFIFGRWLGTHFVAPRISPKKTWEGCIGGYITLVSITLIATQLYPGVLLPSHTLMTMGVSLMVSIAAFIGDAAISWLKRRQHIKDCSHILPGHGGILDRCDSMLLCIPLMYILHAFHIV